MVLFLQTLDICYFRVCDDENLVTCCDDVDDHIRFNCSIRGTFVSRLCELVNQDRISGC
jgi:hypothetical protein